MADPAERYERLTADQMDEQRIQNVAYQYLCRLEEAKRWMEVCLGEELPVPTRLEECLRNGVFLAKLAHRFAPSAVTLKKIYDLHQHRYQAVGLQFRHTDNINHWRVAMTTLGLPAIFHPETTDVYDKKNMPRAIYCIHALSLYLYRLGVAPPIQDLCGKVKFTEEEISHMKMELDKYGIQMPAFNKIGGILANELSEDEAAGHAAVIAINQAVELQQEEATAAALRNPNAGITNLQTHGKYQKTLQQEKHRKRGRSRCEGSDDVYEHFLTRREIQNIINTVNVRAAVQRVDEALDSQDENSLLAALQQPCLSLRGLRSENSLRYLQQLLEDREQGEQEECVCLLDVDELQDGVTTANQDAASAAALQKVNLCLRGCDPRLTLTCMMSSDLHLPAVLPFAAELYHTQLQLLQRQTEQVALQQEELFVAVEMLSAVALVNQAVEAGHLQHFSSSLASPAAGLTDINSSLLHRYFRCVSELKQQVGDFLTWNHLQEEINRVNQAAEEEQQQLLLVGQVNEAVVGGDAERLLSALLHTCWGLQALPANTCRYLSLLTRARQHRAQVSGDPGAELWLADIQEAVRRANQESQSALKLCLAVAAINQAVKENKASQTLRVLSLPEAHLHGVIPTCAADYQRELHRLLTTRRQTGDSSSPWVGFRMADGSLYFFHLQRLQGGWEEPKGFTHNSVFMDHLLIQEVVRSVWDAHRRGVLWGARLALLVRLQAAGRGFLLRRSLEAQRSLNATHTPAAITIQSHWRRFVQQTAYRRRLQFLYMNWRAVVKIQAAVRMWITRRNYRARLSFFRQNVGAVVKIQAFFRASRARAEYRMLVHSDTPPLAVVRKFAHLLDLGDGDIREEAELLRLREEVVRTIRFNRQLEADLDLMDLKIGLLVRNRATLQEVVSHCKKLTKKNKEQLCGMMDVERGKGLKALSREQRDRLEAYQHLFYLLQTRPLYLAQLIFLLPQSRCSLSVESFVFGLFGFGSGRREAHLLLHLFTEALRYEIRLRVDRPQDVVSGSPAVVRLAVCFYRRCCEAALRAALGGALQDVLTQQLCTNTDPLHNYHTWISTTETQTGIRSSLPYDVSPVEALSHPEVRRRVDVAVINLKNLTDRVLTAITSNLHLLPYGLRYIAKVLRDTLRVKFPESSEDEIYKVVGNLVYYRYLNPAIVAPDGFDVLDRAAGSSLQPEQRHLLGSIARTLQHGAANKRFHGDGHHVAALNQYIGQTHGRFRRFLQSVCEVPDPEDRFGVDEFSELLTVHRPVIYISIQELLHAHQLLLEHQEVLSPDPKDPLRLLLKDLGPVPSLQDLTGESSPCGKMEVSLTLTNKFDVFSEADDKLDARALLLSTKQLIVDVIRTQPGDSLRDILMTSASHDQEVSHRWLVQRRALQDARAPAGVQRNPSLVAHGNLSLPEKKRKILRGLRRLEGLGALQTPHPENQILQMVAKDIRQQRLHRQRRGAELQRLRRTLTCLQEKSSFHSEQVDYYRHYITSCLDHLNSKSTNRKAAEAKGRKKTVSYSGAQLQDRGILLEIQDLPSTQFRNVQFDISRGPEVGSFSIKARFLGIDMEEFLLQYQDLLQLQYEGVAVMKIFDKAKVNVNLLIFLLNKKFFKK